MELNTATLDRMPALVIVPDYDRTAVTPGIAHLSVGNFHRAHQAVYTDRVLGIPGQSDWGIVGIGLLDIAPEAEKAAALQAQNGLYTLTECPSDRPDVVRVVKSLVEYIHAPADRVAAIRRLADPAIRIVTMTITEGGYYMDETGRFMSEHPAIAEDLKRDVPHTPFGILVEASRLRRNAGVEPFTVLSCDNVPHNGHVARNAVLSWAELRDKELAEWIGEHIAFPSCMVDRITPAVRPADAARLNAASSVNDLMPVFCEDFIQWVVEDNFPVGRPAWEKVGVLFTDNVAPYEQVKLRMLNASHSMMGIPGVLMGHRVVSEAMKDARIVSLLEEFLGFDSEPQLTAPPGISLPEYGLLLLNRFRNPAISDQLLRIASDSSSKLPVFVGDTARGVLGKGQDARRIAFLLASYCAYLTGRDDHGNTFEVVEPRLGADDRALAMDENLTRALEMSVFAGWGVDENPQFSSIFVEMRNSIRERGVAATLEKILLH